MPKRQSGFVNNNVAVDSQFDEIEYSKIVDVHDSLTAIDTLNTAILDGTIDAIEADLDNGANSSIVKVGSNLPTITAVAEAEDKLDAIIANQANIDNVSDNMADVVDVANNKANIDAVAYIAPNINTVGGNIDDVEAVANNISDVETVANNIALISSVGNVGITAFAIKQTEVVALPDTTTVTLTNAITNLSNITVDVFVNGLKLTPDEFTTAGTNDITFIDMVLQPLDVVDVTAEKEYDVANTYTKPEIDAKVEYMQTDFSIMSMPKSVVTDHYVIDGTRVGMVIDSMEISDGASVTIADEAILKVI